MTDKRLTDPTSDAYKAIFHDVSTHATRDRLTVFLYLLMRDRLTPGEVAGLAMSCYEGDEEGPTVLSNGYLGKFAEHLAKKLKQPMVVEEPVSTEACLEEDSALV